MQRMDINDLDEVMEIERKSFSSPWTRGMYLHELEKSEGCYMTARHDGILAAYGGTLLILDEAHVMTLAVRGDYRRRGLGARLFLEIIDASREMGARFFTLEVRKSNREAIDLYARFGFQIMGERKNYYLDNMENALIMWTEDITAPEYRGLLEGLRRRYGDACS
ncbi:MAG: ribosomal protein S18-alanine N-acetyltransferase [Actinomycetota bacterium]